VTTDIAVAPIDPDHADTATLNEVYGLPPEASANCVLVAGTREGVERIAACLIPATTFADVNHVIRKLLDVRKASFMSRERAVAESGQEYGGIGPLGLPTGWRVLVDARFAEPSAMALQGSGVRHSKILMTGPMLCAIPGAEVIDGLAVSR
jgi:prolyl-tRNA editing enzyme YbaK/EbsC (Cys-tRNA(Pro) deacylase)